MQPVLLYQMAQTYTLKGGNVIHSFSLMSHVVITRYLGPL